MPRGLWGEMPSDGQTNTFRILVETVEFMGKPCDHPTTQLKLDALYSGICSM